MWSYDNELKASTDSESNSGIDIEPKSGTDLEAESNLESESNPSRRRCIVRLLILGVAGIVVWKILGKPTPDEIIDLDVLDNFTGFDFFDREPYLTSNKTDQWRSGGRGGLELTLVNALTDDWYDEFNDAVLDWDNGMPDVLTLHTEISDFGTICEPMDGKMVVCNANFGDTGWIGYNEWVVSLGFIVNSVAKMNEYYLHNANRFARQYAMCHELGHGFGLPHTDESFTNRNLGNCMDYTKKYRTNMRPDEINFIRLKSLYGEVPPSDNDDNNNRRQQRQLLFDEEEEDDDVFKDYNKKPSQDVLRNHKIAIEEIEQDLKLIDDELNMLQEEAMVRSSLNENEDDFLPSDVVSSSGWRRLKQHAATTTSSSSSSSTNDGNSDTSIGDGGAYYRKHLGEGVFVVVYALYANDELS